jgi:hypothetical protein
MKGFNIQPPFSPKPAVGLALRTGIIGIPPSLRSPLELAGDNRSNISPMDIYASPSAAALASASRQKNCNSCVQTKRRCDRRTPVCSRCVEKKLRCVYGKTKEDSRRALHQYDTRPSPTFIPFELENSAAAAAAAATTVACSVFPPDMSLDMGFFESMASDAQTGLAEPTLVTPGMDSFMNAITAGDSTPQDQWLIETDQEIYDDRPSTPAGQDVESSYSHMATFCVSAIRPCLASKLTSAGQPQAMGAA